MEIYWYKFIKRLCRLFTITIPVKEIAGVFFNATNTMRFEGLLFKIVVTKPLDNLQMIFIVYQLKGILQI